MGSVRSFPYFRLFGISTQWDSTWIFLRFLDTCFREYWMLMMLSDTCFFRFPDFFRASSTVKKLKVVGKVPASLSVMVVRIHKTMITKMNITCGPTKKFSGSAYVEFGKFSICQHHNNNRKSFAVIEKTKIESRLRSESETKLSRRGIFMKLSTPKMLT